MFRCELLVPPPPSLPPSLPHRAAIIPHGSPSTTEAQPHLLLELGYYESHEIFR